MLDQLEFMATQHDTTEIETKQSIKCSVARNCHGAHTREDRGTRR